jgi:hypothetical protein
MVKTQQKPLINEKNLINHNPNTPSEYSELKKSRKQIYQENYQKHKEKKKKQRRVRYQQQKKQMELSTQQQ